MTINFFRPAQKEDFEGFEIEYDHGRYMSNEVKTLIEKNDFQGALKFFKEETGLGMRTLKNHCEAYQTYVFAKRDFENGKQVFVSY